MRKKFFTSPAARRAVSAAMAMAIAFSMNISPLSAIADSLITPVSASQASYSVVNVPEGDYYIVSSSSDNFCLDVMGGSTEQCAGLWLWTKSSGNPAQIYSLKHISGDWYIIEHKASGMTLNLPNANNANGQTLWLWPYDGTDACLWRFADSGDGTYVLQNKLGRVLDLDNNLLFDGSRVHVWDLHGGASCKWELQPVNTSGTSAVSNTTLYVKTSGTSSRLNLRSSPSTSSSSIAKLSFGTKVTLLGEYNNGWSKVKTNDGLIGYASSQYLSKSDPLAVTFGASTSVVPANSTAMSTALYGTSGGRISCGFDGYTTTSGRHEGIDFVRNYGAAVYSLTDGVITRITKGSNGSNGLSTIAVYIPSVDKTVVYLHAAPLNSLYEGQNIQRGQQIATEAWRGVSKQSSSHTHVEVRNGRHTGAAKSVDDYTLENTNPTNFWNSMGYQVK